jgi:hypothetical protein
MDGIQDLYKLLDANKYQEAKVFLQCTPNSDVIPSSHRIGYLCYSYYKLGEYEKILPLVTNIKSHFYTTRPGMELFPFIGKTLLKEKQLKFYQKVLDSLPSDYFLYDYRTMDQSISPYSEKCTSNFTPILFNTLPKSGSVFLNAALSSLLESKTILAPINQFPNSKIYWKSIERLQGSNTFTHGHFPATDSNLETINEKFSKVILHIRDPRQAVHSWYRFIDSNFDKTGPYLYNIPENYGNLKDEEKLYFFFHDQLNIFIDWIEQWMKVKQAKHENILFTTYEKFIGNKYVFYSEILAFLNLDLDIDHIISKENSKYNIIKTEKSFHFREGKKSSWKEELPPHWVKHLNERVSNSSLDTFCLSD